MIPTAQIAFRNMDPAAQIEAAVTRKIAALERYFSRIVSCRVVIRGPRSENPGGLYSIRIELGLPGGELVVDHTLNHARPAIHEAFDAMRRQLQDHVRRMRGDIKDVRCTRGDMKTHAPVSATRRKRAA